MRENGVLMPIFALPSAYGIGCFSEEAYAFVDMLRKAGQKWWQILPLGPTGYGDSPYQSFSTFAGNPYFISLDQLAKDGLLKQEELENTDFGTDACHIDYGKLYHTRFQVLQTAYQRFQPSAYPEYAEFIETSRYWLEDYCLYMAVKDRNGGRPWTMWEEPLKKREPEALQAAREELKEEIGFYRFQQFFFWKQWEQLHAYANANGVKIIGDIPIYVAFDSVDTWAGPQLFQFDEEIVPLGVAGCPPDGFSPTGQLWGNPLYRWEYHKQTGYAWWTRRIAYCLEQFDMLRIDHFRGFDEYYAIPYGSKDAVKGHWEKGPGLEFFDTMKQKLGNMNIIAEDLGFLTQSVRDLVKATGYPGMKILEFAFDSREESDYLPHNFEKNCVVYTGTHDNDTLRGWYDKLDEADRKFAAEYMGNERTPAADIYKDFIRLAMSSIAELCIIPIQDFLGLGDEARINTPSTLGGNWKWRLKKGEITDMLIKDMWEMTRIYGRL